MGVTGTRGAPFICGMLPFAAAAVAAACARAVALTYMVASSLNEVGRFVASVPRHPAVGVAGMERCSARRIAGDGATELSGRAALRGLKEISRDNDESMPVARSHGQRSNKYSYVKHTYLLLEITRCVLLLLQAFPL